MNAIADFGENTCLHYRFGNMAVLGQLNNIPFVVMS